MRESLNIFTITLALLFMASTLTAQWSEPEPTPSQPVLTQDSEVLPLDSYQPGDTVTRGLEPQMAPQMAPEPNREPTEELRGESDPTKLNNSGPISITADHMLADDKTREITFTGKVVARQGELIISCDRMRVSYIPKGAYERSQTPSTPSLAPSADPRTPATPGAPSGDSPLEGGQEIDQVNCQGAVKIQQGDRLAVGDSALYLAKALPRRLVLTGDARVWQGENSITGHQITYYLDENRSLVDSQGGGRVRAFYNQGASGRE